MEPGAKFERKQIEAFGYTIDYAEAGPGAGSGDVIVSLPGSAGLEMSTAKDMLSERFRVIEINPPGWGESAPLTGSMTQRHLAQVLGAAVDAIGVERYHLIGTSLGGNNALWTAFHYPDRVRSVLLEGSMVFSQPDNLVNPKPMPQGHALRAGLAGLDPSIYPAPPTHPRKPWSTDSFFHEQMRRRFKAFAYLDRDDDAPLERFARSTTIPVRLLLGTEDEILKQSYAARFKEIVPSATVTIIDGATHDIQNTAPEAFVAAVREVVGA